MLDRASTGFLVLMHRRGVQQEEDVPPGEFVVRFGLILLLENHQMLLR
jgi:hypothetical protein